MARNYNYIYSQLVEDRKDIVGHIAYALYKEDKIAFIGRYKEEPQPVTICNHINPLQSVTLWRIIAELLTNKKYRHTQHTERQSNNKATPHYNNK